jgi:hypothetical protein
LWPPPITTASHRFPFGSCEDEKGEGAEDVERQRPRLRTPASRRRFVAGDIETYRTVDGGLERISRFQLGSARE